MTQNPKTMIRILAEVSTERPAVIGWLGGWAGIFGAITLERATQWVAFATGVVGLLSATAALVYTVIRIRRIIKKKDATE